jgi:hypothetical protein
MYSPQHEGRPFPRASCHASVKTMSIYLHRRADLRARPASGHWPAASGFISYCSQFMTADLQSPMESELPNCRDQEPNATCASRELHRYQFGSVLNRGGCIQDSRQRPDPRHICTSHMERAELNHADGDKETHAVDECLLKNSWTIEGSVRRAFSPGVTSVECINLCALVRPWTRASAIT